MDLSKYSQENYSRGKSSFVILLWWFVQGTLFRFSLHNFYGFRAFLLRLFGAKIGSNTKIRSSAKFTYPWNVSIGENSWVGDDVIFYSLDEIIVGANTVISQKTYLCTGSHDINSESFSLVTNPINIEDEVWIAADCFIFPSVTVKTKTILSARSTLKESTLAGYIYSGNPAILVKKREIK